MFKMDKSRRKKIENIIQREKNISKVRDRVTNEWSQFVQDYPWVSTERAKSCETPQFWANRDSCSS